jgi:hypothetical protein
MTNLCRDHNGVFRWFIPLNIVAALGHLFNVIATFAFSSQQGRDAMYPIYQTYAEWTTKELACNSSMNLNSSYEIIRPVDDMPLVVTPTATAIVYKLSLFWLIVSFHALSFAFQIGIPVVDFIANRFNLRYGKSCHKHYVKDVLNRGVNSLRFVEYSVSASIMLVCLAILSNILKLYSLIGVGVLSAATMLFGLIAEVLFSDAYLAMDITKRTEIREVTPSSLVGRATFNNEYVVRELPVSEAMPVVPVDTLATDLRRLGWIAHFSGWITMGAAYGGILVQHFFWSVAKSEEANPDGPSAPDFVRALIIALAVLYNIFGFSQLFQLCAKDPWMGVWTGRKDKCGCLKYNGMSKGAGYDGRKISCCRVSLNEGIERFYVFNSLITKTILGWTIISQLLGEEQSIGTDVVCN